MRMILAALLLVVGASPLPAHALCLTAMLTRASATAAATGTGSAASTIAIGHPTRLALQPIAAMHWPDQPTKKNGPYAGLAAIDVPNAGTFTISLGARVWIDVLEGSTAIASTSHRHGAACSGIAKQVVFPMVAGRHVIEVSGSAAPRVAILVTAGS